MSIDNHVKFRELVDNIIAEEEKYYLTRTTIITVAKEVYENGLAQGLTISIDDIKAKLQQVYKEKRVDSIVDALINEKSISEEQKAHALELTMEEIERHLGTPHSGSYPELSLNEKIQIKDDVKSRLEAEPVHFEKKEPKAAFVDFKMGIEKAIRNIANRYRGGNYGGFFCRPSEMDKKMQRFCEQISHFIASKECHTSLDLDNFIFKNMAHSGTFRKEWAKENMPDIFKGISIANAKREWENRRKPTRP